MTDTSYHYIDFLQETAWLIVMTAYNREIRVKNTDTKKATNAALNVFTTE